jgi:hypothetical protein
MTKKLVCTLIAWMFSFTVPTAAQKTPIVQYTVEVSTLKTTFHFNPPLVINPTDLRSLTRDINKLSRHSLVGCNRGTSTRWLTIIHLGGPNTNISDILSLIARQLKIQLQPAPPPKGAGRNTARGSPPRAIFIFKFFTKKEDPPPV